MLLTNLFQLTQDLDKNLNLFYSNDSLKHAIPIRKINLTSDKCCLICKEGNPRTLRELNSLLGKIKQKNIPVFIEYLHSTYNIFGLQINNENKQIYLK